jgi:hypothetical protein
MIDKKDDQYSAKEATARFEAALRGALRTPHTPLKKKHKVKAAKKTKPKKASK